MPRARRRNDERSSLEKWMVLSFWQMMLWWTNDNHINFWELFCSLKARQEWTDRGLQSKKFAHESLACVSRNSFSGMISVTRTSALRSFVFPVNAFNSAETAFIDIHNRCAHQHSVINKKNSRLAAYSEWLIFIARWFMARHGLSFFAQLAVKFLIIFLRLFSARALRIP